MIKDFSFGGTRKKFTEYIQGLSLAREVRKLSRGSSSKQKNLEDIGDTTTAYKRWKKKGGRLSNSMIASKRSRMQLIDNKPYLRENVVGDRADFGGVLSLLFFMMVIGLWLYSARGMVGTFLDWVGIIDKESNFQVISYEDVSSDLDVVK